MLERAKIGAIIETYYGSGSIIVPPEAATRVKAVYEWYATLRQFAHSSFPQGERIRTYKAGISNRQKLVTHFEVTRRLIPDLSRILRSKDNSRFVFKYCLSKIGRQTTATDKSQVALMHWCFEYCPVFARKLRYFRDHYCR